MQEQAAVSESNSSKKQKDEEVKRNTAVIFPRRVGKSSVVLLVIRPTRLDAVCWYKIGCGAVEDH